MAINPSVTPSTGGSEAIFASMLKCRQHSVEVVEVFGKDIAKECSRCGNMGKREGNEFVCVCGYRAPMKQNVAANIKKRGLTKK